MLFYGVILIISHIQVMLALPGFTPIRWNMCYVGEAFLTIYDAPLRRCVWECQVRSRCEAVNYWTGRRVCELLEEADGPLQSRDKPCVGIAKTDMKKLDGCQSCSAHQVCDPENNVCTIKECYAPPIVNNGELFGNMIQVGTKRKLVCHQYYEPEPEIHQIECHSDGGWGTVPQCVPTKGCPAPPPVTNAVAGEITGVVLPETVVMYSCLSGFAAPDDNNNLQMTCQADGSWSPVSFECVKDCGKPPDVSFATVSSGTTHEGSIRQYTCDTNHYIRVGGILSSETEHRVTCQSNGAWDTAFECVPCSCPSNVALVSGTCGIADSAITASSVYNVDTHRPYHCRMTLDKAWATSGNDVNDLSQYIQFDLSTSKYIKSITTQGSRKYQDFEEWVTSYKIRYSNTGCRDFVTINQTFSGNTDAYDLKTNTFQPSFLARCIQVNPLTSESWRTMRIELHGCL